MNIVQYHEVCHQMRSGDVIAFAGADILSGTVRLSTQSTVSHVGAVFQPEFMINGPSRINVDGKPDSEVDSDAKGDQNPSASATEDQEHISLELASSLLEIDMLTTDQPEIYIIESHPLCFDQDTGIAKSGVQINKLSALMDGYDGQIWWLPLGEQHRSRLDLQKFTNFMRQSEKRAYDFVQAALAGLDFLDEAGLTCAQEDHSSFFCSELIAAAFQAAGLIQGVNPSETTPIDLCRFPIYAEDYYLLWGDPIEIPGYNTAGFPSTLAD